MNIKTALCASSLTILIYAALTYTTPVQEAQSLQNYATEQFYAQTEKAKARLGQELIQRIIAGSIGYETVASYICDHNVDPNFQDKSNRTLLIHAIIQQRKDFVRCLLEHGASVTLSGANNETPLHWAARMHAFDILIILLKKNAGVNQKDTGEQTALMYAAQAGYSRIARCLLDHGALKAPRDAAGRTAQMHAQKNGHEKLARLLAPHAPLPRSFSQRILSLSPRAKK